MIIGIWIEERDRNCCLPEAKANTAYPFSSFEKNQTLGHSAIVHWQAIITNITSNHL